MHKAVFFVLTCCSLSLSACTPPGTSPSAAFGSSAPAGSEGIREISTAETDAASIDEPCDLPSTIREDDWPSTLAPTLPGSPEAPLDGATTLAVLPDTQYYASCKNGHLLKQSQWLSEQAKSRGILAAVQLGDLTEHNSEDEWQFVVDGLAPLRKAMPLLVSTGNHDFGDAGSANRRTTFFQKYFSKPAAPTASVVAELMRPGDYENAYYRIANKGIQLGVLIVEWSPRTKTVEWAQSVLKKYQRDRVIFITHAYLYYDGTRYDWASKGAAQKWNPRSYGTAKKDPEQPSGEENWAEAGAYDGEMLWQQLLIDHPGVFLTLNGHVLGDGSGLLLSRGNQGNLVAQVLVNYQMLDEGGLGYLRLIEIAPDGKSLQMKTYSPSLDLTATAPDQQFDVPIDPPLYDK